MFTQTCLCAFTQLNQYYLQRTRTWRHSPFYLDFFFHQKISFTLQKIQTSSILNQAITVGLITSQLPLLQATPPSPWLIYYKQLVVEMESFWHLVCANLTSFKFSLVFNSFGQFLNLHCVLYIRFCRVLIIIIVRMWEGPNKDIFLWDCCDQSSLLERDPESPLNQCLTSC
jgi:hypothetical protein